jgi:hypothetical protein
MLLGGHTQTIAHSMVGNLLEASSGPCLLPLTFTLSEGRHSDLLLENDEDDGVTLER